MGMGWRERGKGKKEVGKEAEGREMISHGPCEGNKPEDIKIIILL